MAGPMLRPGDGYASTSRRIAASAVTSDTGHLKSGLIEYHIVCLIGMGVGIVSSHCNIDRIIQYERCVNDAAIEVSISAVAGVVSTACDQIGVNPVVVGRASREDRHASAARRIIVAAMTAPTGCLGCALEELHCIRLMGVSGAMKARHRDVDWIKDRDGGMHQGP